MTKELPISPIVKIGDTISYLKMDSYPGGKAIDGTYQVIINQILPHKEFISGFFGHCGITRIKKPSEVTIGIEPDQSVIEDWKSLVVPIQEKSFLNSLYLINCEFLQVIDQLLPSLEKPFLYLDPPYPKNSRKSSVDIYKYEMTDDQHIELLSWVVRQDVPICISSYPNKLYDEYLKEWRNKKFQSKTRQGLATEIMYMNYEEPTQLHDYRFIGKNFRERERIKRRTTSMKRKFSQLAPLEQAMLMEEFISIIAENSDAFRKGLLPGSIAEYQDASGF